MLLLGSLLSIPRRVRAPLLTNQHQPLCSALTTILFKKQPGGKKGIAAEKQAAMTSCTRASGHTVGLRPACWYKARM